jgi:pimeloyl-ACP methyl ester carboxylesterase
MNRTDDTTRSGLRFHRSGGGSHAVVFVHGFLDDASVWNDVIAGLGADAEIVRFDLAGMGQRVDADGPFTLERFASDVVDIADAVDKRFVIVGQSMGAQIAELVAMRRPDRVAGLVLVTPVPLAGTSLPDDAIEPFRSLGRLHEAQLAVRRQLTADLGGDRLEQLTNIGMSVRPEVVVATADAWNAGHASGKSESGYRGPVLVLSGANDGFVTEDLLNQGVLPRYRNVQRATIERAGHWPHFEQPRAVAAVLDAFLARVDWAPPAEPPLGATPVQKQGWTQAFAEKSADTFADAFDPGVVLEASVLARPVNGRDQVKAVMGVASKIYEHLAFTHEAANGQRNYLEWEARAFGGQQLFGVTVLTKNDAGKILAVAIHHRPLNAALRFSQELRIRLDGVIAADHFHPA